VTRVRLGRLAVIYVTADDEQFRSFDLLGAARGYAPAVQLVDAGRRRADEVDGGQDHRDDDDLGQIRVSAGSIGGVSRWDQRFPWGQVGAGLGTEDVAPWRESGKTGIRERWMSWCALAVRAGGEYRRRGLLTRSSSYNEPGRLLGEGTLSAAANSI